MTLIYNTLKRLKERLREEGLPHNQTFLTTLAEGEGVAKPDALVDFSEGNKRVKKGYVRLYTDESIERIVGDIKTLKGK